MVAILFVTMETGGLAEKSSIYFLLSMTHSTNWPEKISQTANKKNPAELPYLTLTRLDNFVNAKDMLNSSQYGFRTAMSTSHAIMEVTEEIETTQKHAVGVFIDCKKAFNAVDHEILIKKINFYVELEMIG